MPYSTFFQFGKELNPSEKNPTNSANPLTYCLLPTLNSQFFHGSTSAGQLYSNSNTACSNFMAERCQNKWDSYCDAFVELNQDTYWPNLGVMDQLAFDNAKLFWNLKTTVGDDLIRNVMYHRYICPQHQYSTREPFDPNVANSPMIQVYDNYVPYYSKVIGLHDFQQIQTDPYIPKMIQHAKLCTDVLGRIFLGYIRKEPNLRLEGTVLEQFFRDHWQVWNQYVSQAIQFVPSFQIENQPPYLFT